jgi:uncharacterized protein Yka (UPF0111/DUF47 family)
MFSLQRLLGHPKEFFGLLEQSAALGREAATALADLVARPTEHPSLERITTARRQDKEVINRLEERLSRVFITPIEREDLEEIAQGLYRIPKAVEKFAERFEFVWEQVQDVDFTLGARMLVRASELVEEMVQSLGSDGALGKIKSTEARLSQIEAEASHIILASTRALFLPGNAPLKIVIAKDLFDILAEGIEECRAIGRTLALVVLKNS